MRRNQATPPPYPRLRAIPPRTYTAPPTGLRITTPRTPPDSDSSSYVGSPLSSERSACTPTPATVIGGLRSTNIHEQLSSFDYLKNHFPVFEEMEDREVLLLINTLIELLLPSPYPVICSNALQTLSALACDEKRGELIIEKIPFDLLLNFFESENVYFRNAAASFLLAYSSSENGLKTFAEKFSDIIVQLPVFFLRESNLGTLGRYIESIKYIVQHLPETQETFREDPRVLPKLMTIIESFSDNPMQKNAEKILDVLAPCDRTPAYR